MGSKDSYMWAPVRIPGARSQFSHACAGSWVCTSNQVLVPYRWVLLCCTYKSLTETVACALLSMPMSFSNSEAVQRKNIEDWLSMSLWRPVVPSAKGNQEAQRLLQALSLKEITSQVPQISLAFSQFLWQLAEVLLSLEFLWQKQGNGQLGVLESVSLQSSSTGSESCSRYNSQSQCLLGCSCYSFRYHNMERK